jgi:hypothetical protein
MSHRETPDMTPAVRPATVQPDPTDGSFCDSKSEPGGLAVVSEDCVGGFDRRGCRGGLAASGRKRGRLADNGGACTGLTPNSL